MNVKDMPQAIFSQGVKLQKDTQPHSDMTRSETMAELKGMSEFLGQSADSHLKKR